MLSVLKSSGIELYKIVSEEDPIAVAERLCGDHTFKVNVIAVRCVDPEKLLHVLSEYHVNHGWHTVNMKHIVGILGDATRGRAS